MTTENPSKNIVICCDGTGNQFGDHNSNVIKLFSVLRRNSQQQVLYYHPGVGTKNSMEIPTYLGLVSQKIKKWHAFAYGYGVIDNLARAYGFLMENYLPGDKVFLIGFSRGSFTVRALCSLIYEFGLLEKGNDSLIDYAMSLFTNASPLSLKLARNFKTIFGRECSIHFVGVWDTVSSVGWIYDPLSIPYSCENPIIKIGRHAIAIDEHRTFFRPNLWGKPTENQDLKQVWFAGAHCDVGGSYPYKESGLANISLHWLLKEAEEAGLMVDAAAKEKLFQENPPDPNAILHHSLHGIWWLPEYLPQKYTVREENHYRKKLGIHFGRHRRIPENAMIHQSVIERIKNQKNNYNPKNLPETYEVVL